MRCFFHAGASNQFSPAMMSSRPSLLMSATAADSLAPLSSWCFRNIGQRGWASFFCGYRERAQQSKDNVTIILIDRSQVDSSLECGSLLRLGLAKLASPQRFYGVTNFAGARAASGRDTRRKQACALQTASP